jgi:WD40 repeat protein
VCRAPASSSADSSQKTALLAFAPPSPLLVHVAVGPPAEVNLWNCRTCSLVSNCLWPASDCVSALAVLPPPLSPVALLASGDGDARVAAAAMTTVNVELRDWSLECGFAQGGGREADADDPIVALDFSANTTSCLSATRDGAVCVFNVPQRRVLARTAAGDQVIGCSWVSDSACVTVHNSAGASAVMRLWQLMASELVLIVELPLRDDGCCAVNSVACARHASGAAIFCACDTGDVVLTRFMTSPSGGGGCSAAPPLALDVDINPALSSGVLDGLTPSFSHLTVANNDSSSGAACTLLGVLSSRADSCAVVQLRCDNMTSPLPKLSVCTALPLVAALRHDITSASVLSEDDVAPLLAHLHASERPLNSSDCILRHGDATDLTPHRALVTSHADGSACIWDASAAALLPVAKCSPPPSSFTSPIVHAVLCPTSALLCTLHADGALALHSTCTRHCELVSHTRTGAEDCTCLAMATGEAAFAAVGTSSGNVAVLSLPDLEAVGAIRSTDDGDSVTQLMFCGSGANSDTQTALLLILRSSGAVVLASCSISSGVQVIAACGGSGSTPSSPPPSSDGNRRGGIFGSGAKRGAPDTRTPPSPNTRSLQRIAVALAALDASGAPCAPVRGPIGSQFPQQALPAVSSGDGADGDDDDDALRALLGASGAASPPVKIVVITATGAYSIDDPPVDLTTTAPLVPSAARTLEPGAPAVVAGGVCIAMGGTAAILFDESCILHVWDASTLSQVMTIPLAGRLPGAICLQVQRCDDEDEIDYSAPVAMPSAVAIGRDGHLIACWRNSDVLLAGCDTVARIELCDEFSVPHPPPEYPPVNALWREVNAATSTSAPASSRSAAAAEDSDGPKSSSGPGSSRQRGGGIFAGLKAGVARAAEKGRETIQRALAESSPAPTLDWETVFPAMPAPTLVTASSLPAARTPGAATRPTAAASRDDRAALLGEDASDAPRVRTAADIKARYGRTTAGAAGDAAATMSENMDKLRERGQKLSNIQDKTAAMEAEAMQFAENARKLKEMQGMGALFRF